MQTFNYKLFRAPRNRNLKRLTWVAHDIWNYFLGWQRTRHSLGLPYMSFYEMSREFTILRPSHPEIFAHWRELDSWSARNILKRLDDAYQRFFKKIAKRPPKFKSWRKPYSFTLGASGYGFHGDKVRIMKRHYRFNKSREILGNVRTVTIKEDALGDFYMSVVTDNTATEYETKTGIAAGFDFGIKTMLTGSDGSKYESPEFYTTSARSVKNASRQFSTKQRGSNNRERSRKHLARQHRKIARQREDHHWKLALELVRPFDVLFFEDLNLEGMKRLWGRKVSDIGFYAFMQKIKYQSTKRGKRVETIDRWQPTTSVCHVCETRVDLELSDRTWTCEHCKTYHDRDINAAINILKVGALTFGVEGVRLAIASDPC